MAHSDATLVATTRVKRETLALLHCVAPAKGSMPLEDDHELELPKMCGSTLAQPPEEEALICNECERLYPVNQQRPQVVLKTRTDASNPYHNERMIQTYYEVQYAAFIQQIPELRSRLIFPSSGLAERAASDGDGVPIEGFSTFRRHAGLGASPQMQALHTSIAHVAEEPHLTEIFYQSMLELCRPYVQKHTMVLDVGCGLGRMTGELAQLGAKLVVGLDKSAPMVAEAAKILQAREAFPVKLNGVGGKHVDGMLTPAWKHLLTNFDFVVGDVLRLPLRKGTFDLITCLNVLDRIQHTKQMVRELSRVLRPGGYLIIADPYDWDEMHTKDVTEWTDDMATLFDRALWKRVREVDGIPFVLRYYSRRVAIYMNHCVVLQKKA